MSNKQKIIDLLEDFRFLISTDYCINGAESRLDAIKRIADEIDALYHRDCGKCKKNDDKSKKIALNCKDAWTCLTFFSQCTDYYEEADK